MAHGLLKGKRGIISGALNEQSIAWKVAELAHAEGAEIVLTNAPVAMRMGEINQLASEINASIIPADATSDADLEKLFADSQEKLGGPMDFVLHSIGMSPNVRKGRSYDDLNYDCLLYTSDAADERSSVDLGGRRIIQKKQKKKKINAPPPQKHKTVVSQI